MKLKKKLLLSASTASFLVELSLVQRKVRKLKSLLPTALDPERDLNFYPNVTTKNFRGLFLVCALKMSFAPDGWNISDEEHIEWLAELINQELSLFNSI